MGNAVMHQQIAMNGMLIGRECLDRHVVGPGQDHAHFMEHLRRLQPQTGDGVAVSGVRVAQVLVKTGAHQNRRSWSNFGILCRQCAQDVFASNHVSVGKDVVILVTRNIQQHTARYNRRHLGDAQVSLSLEIDVLTGGYCCLLSGIKPHFTVGVCLPRRILMLANVAQRIDVRACVGGHRDRFGGSRRRKNIGQVAVAQARRQRIRNHRAGHGDALLVNHGQAVHRARLDQGDQIGRDMWNGQGAVRFHLSGVSGHHRPFDGLLVMSLRVIIISGLRTEQTTRGMPIMGRIRQSVAWWCFAPGKMSPEALVRAAADSGYEAVELVAQEYWPLVRDHGLKIASIGGHASIIDGLNRRENRDRIVKEIAHNLDLAAKWGIPNLICFSGSRAGLDDETGAQITAENLMRVAKMAEDAGVNLALELLNSKVDHPDYQCDKTVWGLKVIEMVNSPRVKLLYDIYHAQIMEGDIIATIRAHHHHFCHYHTAGNPGRNDLDDKQELNYPPIMRAIADTGYDGFVGQEFIPKGDPAAALKAAFDLCNL